MATGHLLKSSGIPFPATVTNAYCRRPTVVNIRQPPVVSWGPVHGANRSVSLYNKGLTPLLKRSHGVAVSSDGSSAEVDNSITLKNVRLKIRKWANKQWLPVGAAGYGLYCGLLIPLICGRTGAICSTSAGFISYVIERMLGKKSYVVKGYDCGRFRWWSHSRIIYWHEKSF
ncbi:hypothetical protein E3N88_30595 [Mikania micrantha]|uniref:Uncharacterized protein n=1 Tax=Mikania micrantha TaxID=192012 RepID=A0A5N6MM20_9ASTR|nr:hypothetical protein E3N88_30595 [Mikania micrantha]